MRSIIQIKFYSIIPCIAKKRKFGDFICQTRNSIKFLRTSRIAAKNNVAYLMDRMKRDTWIDKRYIAVDGPDCETRHTGCRINSFPTGDCNDRSKSAPCELSRGTRERPLDFLIRGEHRYIPSRSRQCEIHGRVCTNLHRWRRFKDLPPFSRNPDRENAYSGACLVAITFHNPVRVYLHGSFRAGCPRYGSEVVEYLIDS